MQKNFLFISLFLLCFVSNLAAAKIVEEPQERYCLGLPQAVSADKALPVLVCMPGLKRNAKDDINIWVFPADKRGFLLLDLDIDYSAENTAAVYQRIKNIIDHVSVKYNVAKDKIFLAGTSAGGMMAISLVLSYPQEFRAAGVISGARLNPDAKRKIKNAKGQLFYLYHGEKDKNVPIGEFRATKKLLEKSGAVIEAKVLPEGKHGLPSSCYNEIVDWLYQLCDLIP